VDKNKIIIIKMMINIILKFMINNNININYNYKY